MEIFRVALLGERLRPLIAQADLLFCKSADATLLFGCTGEPPVLMSRLKSLTEAHAIFCTFGEQGATLLLRDEFTSQPAIAVQIVDRIGSGDAFAAGVLAGVLAGDVREGPRRGVALAAIALSQHGDRLLTSRAELDAVLAQAGHDGVR